MALFYIIGSPDRPLVNLLEQLLYLDLEPRWWERKDFYACARIEACQYFTEYPDNQSMLRS